CSSVASVTATVAACSCPNPATVTAASAAICSGATANLTATIGGGATTATWTTSGSGTFNPSTGTSTIYTPSAADIAAGSVTITITTDDPDGANTQCSAASTTLVLTITNGIVPTFAAIAAICSGDVAPILPTSSLNGISGTWSPALVSNTASGTYTFTPSAGSCASTASVNVTVNASPQISVSDNCTGATADVTVTIVSGTPTTYSLDSGTAQASTTFAGVANGNHTIVATDANGCSDSEAFATNCIPGCPTITVTGSQSVCAGTTAVYTQAGGVAGGVWSVVPVAAGAIDAGGNFASSGVFAGNATITYTDNSTGLGCAGSIVVVVNASNVPYFCGYCPNM
ncbi:MAG: hypothetical protein IPN94_05040, partial [Sphingobacteriales bacterium]|nr:hypothetical protein [Sphingobacteriales bacterium]